MFSGIVEAIGVVEQITKVKDNIELKIGSPISRGLAGGPKYFSQWGLPDCNQGFR